MCKNTVFPKAEFRTSEHQNRLSIVSKFTYQYYSYAYTSLYIYVCTQTHPQGKLKIL